jgi:hypothetical protein
MPWIAAGNGDILGGCGDEPVLGCSYSGAIIVLNPACRASRWSRGRLGSYCRSLCCCLALACSHRRRRLKMPHNCLGLLLHWVSVHSSLDPAVGRIVGSEFYANNRKLPNGEQQQKTWIEEPSSHVHMLASRLFINSLRLLFLLDEHVARGDIPLH